MKTAERSNGHVSPPAESDLTGILDEYLAALRRGERPSKDDLLRAHPQIAGELSGCLNTLDVLEGCTDFDASASKSDSCATGSASANARTLGDFRIHHEIGRGGMGVVYEAEQISLGRRVALKVLPFASMLDERQLQRFKNEARAAATLNYPNIVPVYSVGCERGVHFYAMQYVEGQTLAAVIDGLRGQGSEGRGQDARGRVSPRREDESRRESATCMECGDSSPLSLSNNVKHRTGADCKKEHLEIQSFDTSEHSKDTVAAALSTLRETKPRDYYRRIAELGIQAAEALDHAHQMGIVHRDIKPANLLVECSHLAVRDRATMFHHAERDDYTPKLYIADFGLARLPTEAGMTMTGDLVGTLRYMSPEQALAKRITVDHRTDIYSLGVTLYELLTLRPTFDGADREEVLRQIAFEEPIPLRRLKPSIPVELETIIHKAISKNPDDRYPTARDLADDLARFCADQPIRAKPPTGLQRAIRWSRQHPRLLISSTLCLLVAFLAALVAAGLVNVERAKTQGALEAKDRALTRAEQDLGVAIGAVDAMYTDVATSWIANETAPTTMQQRFLERATDFYEQIAARTPTSDGEQILAARVYDRIGQIQLYLGNAAEAATALRKSIAIDESLVADVAEQKSELPSRYRRLAEALIETADNESAEEAYRTGLRYVDRIVEEDSSSVEALEEQVHFYHGQAALWARTDQLDKAEATARLAADQIQRIWKLIKRQPQFLTAPKDYLLARIFHARGEHAAAREQAEKALKGCRRVRMNTYRDAREPLELEIDLLQLLGEIREAEGSLEQSAEHYREALDLRRSNFKARLEPADFIVQTYGKNQDNYDGQFEHAAFCSYIETQLRLARVLGTLGRADEAEHILGECTLAARMIWSHRENMVRYHVAEANAWAMAAELLADTRTAEAEPARQHAILIWRHILAWFPGAPAYRSGVHGAINDFEWFRARLPAEAAESLTPLNIRFRPGPPQIPFKKNAADRSWKDAEQAGESRRINLAHAWLHLATSHALLGDQTEARRWFDKATETVKSIDEPNIELTALRNQTEQLLRKRASENQ